MFAPLSSRLPQRDVERTDIDHVIRLSRWWSRNTGTGEVRQLARGRRTSEPTSAHEPKIHPMGRVEKGVLICAISFIALCEVGRFAAAIGAVAGRDGGSGAEIQAVEPMPPAPAPAQGLEPALEPEAK